MKGPSTLAVRRGGRSIRVLLFGASQGGRQTLSQLSRRAKVVGFLDNDPSKRGGEFEGRPVFAPDQIAELDFDLILISSMHIEAIRSQLLDFGVDSSKIATGFLYIAAPPAFPWDAALFLAATALAGVAGAAWLAAALLL